MKVKSIDIKTTGTGMEYKKLTFETAFKEKDMTNIFKDHPLYETIAIGSDIPERDLYINNKGYLAVSNNVSGSTVKPADVKLGFMDQRLKAMDEKLNRILVHIGAADAVETAHATPVGEITFDNPESSPF